MKRIYTLILVSVLVISCAEKEVEYKNLVERNGVMYEVNSDDPFSGKSFELYENQQFKFKGGYSDGLKDGLWEQYIDNGQITQRANYSSGKLDGSFEKYNKENVLKLKANYKDSLLDGNYTKYDSKGKLTSEGLYKKNLKEGNWKSYSNGILRMDAHYKNGKYDGVVNEFTSLKDKKPYKIAESNYKDGKLNGIVMLYNDQGAITLKSNYLNGKKEGQEEIYNSTGTRISEIIYKSDDIKKRKDWTKDGLLKFEGEYPGISIWYDNKGKKRVQGHFQKPNDLNQNSLEVWFNGNKFTPKLLSNTRWQGKSHYKKANGIWREQHGYVYHTFTDSRYNKNLHYTQGNRKMASPLNIGQWKINPYDLPKLSVSTSITKTKYNSRPEYFVITNYDGTSMTVNSEVWKNVPLEK